MNFSTIYTKTAKGLRMRKALFANLPTQMMSILELIDGSVSVEQILRQLGDISEKKLFAAVMQLENEGYIKYLTETSIEEDWALNTNFSPMLVEEIDHTEKATSELPTLAVLLAQEKEANRLEDERKAQEIEIYIRAKENAKAEAEQQAKAASEARAKEAEKKVREASEMIRINQEKQAKVEVEARVATEVVNAPNEVLRSTQDTEDIRNQTETEALEVLAVVEKIRAKEKARRASARQAEAAQQKAEADANTNAEKETQLAAERQAQLKAEARVQAEHQARLEAEALANAKELARLQQVEGKARINAEAQARKEAERIEKQEKSEALAREKKEQQAAEQLEREEAKILAKEMMAARPPRAKNKYFAKAAMKFRQFKLTNNFKSQFLKWLPKILKVTVVYLPIMALLLLGLMHIVPLSMLENPIEKLASESLGTPVSIGNVRASIWPHPHFVLNGVDVGESAALHIDAVHVAPSISSLFGDTKEVKSLVIEGLEINHKDFSLPLQWLARASKAEHLKIEQVALKKVNVKIRDLVLPTFDGKVELSAMRQLSSILLNSVDQKLTVEMLPREAGHIVKLTANNWTLPANPKIVFEELSASGTFNENMLNFSHVNGRIYGGKLTANTTISWSNLWMLSGQFNVEKANAADILKAFASTGAVNGKVSLDGNFAGQATELAIFGDAATLTANFVMPNGKISGVDLPRAMMARDDKSLEGYATNFDSLTDSVEIKDASFQYRNLVLSGPNLRAQGQIDITKNHDISGKINARLSTAVNTTQTVFDLTGKVGNVKRR